MRVAGASAALHFLAPITSRLCALQPALIPHFVLCAPCLSSFWHCINSPEAHANSHSSMQAGAMMSMQGHGRCRYDARTSTHRRRDLALLDFPQAPRRGVARLPNALCITCTGDTGRARSSCEAWQSVLRSPEPNFGRSCSRMLRHSADLRARALLTQAFRARSQRNGRRVAQEEGEPIEGEMGSSVRRRGRPPNCGGRGRCHCHYARRRL